MITVELGVAIVAGFFSIVSLFLSTKTEHRLTQLEEGKVDKDLCSANILESGKALSRIEENMLKKSDCAGHFIKVNWLWKNYEMEAASGLKNPPRFDSILTRVEEGESISDVLRTVDDEKRNTFLAWLHDQSINGEGERKLKARILLGMHHVEESLRAE